MAKYLIIGIQEYQWKHFKAACDIQGISMKKSFHSHINHVVSDFHSNPEYTQGWPNKRKKGDKEDGE